jgi:uracil phosphoribosyltransferase
MAFNLVDHPLAKHFVGQLRDKTTGPSEFRVIAQRLTVILAVEATRQLKTTRTEVHTPMAVANAEKLDVGITAVPILRAGLGMLQPITELLPDVTVGFIGLERDESTAIASSYYCKLPTLHGRSVLLLDPMLATGGSASQAVEILKSRGADAIVLLAVVAATEGVERLVRDHPDVSIYAAAVDAELDARKFIIPGLGDFGDRLFGTES